MDSSQRAARIVRTIVETLQPRFAVELWTGERIGPDGGPVVRIADSRTVRKMVRRPTFDTLLQLWTSKGIDVQGGSLFDIVELRPAGSLKAKLRTLPKLQLLRDVPSLLLSSIGRNSADAGLAGSNPFASGSDKRAIEHHYDISNDFYRLFLDDRMVYTCGYFKDFSNDINQAQVDKLEHICRKLRLKPGERLLDIGCGWGAMLIHAAKHHGVVGHGVSLSDEQTMLARKRICAEGLQDRISIDIKSYTDVTGSFDKISSIGMFEAVGLANHGVYFSTVNRLLKPGGIYLHHAITRRNKTGRKRRDSAQYKALQKYIFPGGAVDHIGMTLANLEAHGFEVHDVENFREHYAHTCKLWAERLHARFDEATAEIGEAKARLWLLYLTGCSLGFDRGTIQIYQTVATKRARGSSGLPPTRADLYRDE